MAHETAKKNAKNNQARLKTFTVITAALLVICFFYKAYWKYSTAIADAETALAAQQEAILAAEEAAAQKAAAEEAAIAAGTKKKLSKKQRREMEAASAKADKILGGATQHLIGDGGSGVPIDIDSITLNSYMYSFWSLFEVTFWGSHYALALFFLTALGKPTRADPSDPNSEIIDCADLSDPKQLGLYSYAQDILWWCWISQFMYDIVTKYAICMYFPIPCLIVYKIFSSVISPLLQNRNQMAQQQQMAQQDEMYKQQEAYLDKNDPRRKLARKKEEMAAKGKGQKKQQ